MAPCITQAIAPEQLAECLRMLALHIADYRSRFGEIPRQDLLDFARSDREQRRPGPSAERRHGAAHRLLLSVVYETAGKTRMRRFSRFETRGWAAMGLRSLGRAAQPRAEAATYLAPRLGM